MLEQKYIQKLMQTPMDRKQFLRYIGVAALGVIGINKIIGLMLQSHPATKQLTNKSLTKRSFGEGKYGV